MGPVDTQNAPFKYAEVQKEMISERTGKGARRSVLPVQSRRHEELGIS